MATKKYVSLDKLGLYDEKIKKVIGDGDAAALKSAKDYADSLAVNYEKSGAAATAEANAKAYADGKDAAIQAAHKAGTDAAAAAAVADGKAVAAQGEVDALEQVVADLDAYVGDIPDGYTEETVIAYINKKAEETLNAASGGSTESAASVKAALDTEIARAKAAEEANATAASNAQAAADAEKERAMGIEGGLRTDIDKVMGDYLKSADKTELQGNIDTVAGAVERLTNGVSADEVDGVNDLIQYVKDHGTEVTGMQEDISDNADAIAGVAGRMDTAEGKITALETASALHAEKTYVDGKVEALEETDSGFETRIAALEGKFGEGDGSVEDQIADAKAAAVSEATAAAATDATNKANAAESNAKSHANDLNTAMSARVDALEAIDHDHANKAELDLIATGDKAKWDAAAAIAHEHSNAAVLNGITAENITTWNTVTSKAAASDLTAATDRITALETWHNNFTECSEDEINALFA